MIDVRKRDQTRERVRRFRARQRGEEHAPPVPTCGRCSAQLSRYAEPDATLCAPCFRTHGTHEEYVDTQGHKTGEHHRTAYTCARGHDLEQHGQIVDAGNGRTTRRCSICRKERQREYQRNRRARDKAAA